MGDDPQAAPAAETTGGQYAAFVQYLPGILQTIARETPGFEKSQLASKVAIAPDELAYFNEFGPKYAEAGTKIQKAGALGQASTERDVLEGPGGELVRSALRLNKEIDPEFYAGREAASAKLLELLSTLDPTGFSGSELAEVERGVNRSNSNKGVANLGGNSAAISNALVFGDRLQQKKSNIAQILSTVPSQLASYKSGVDVLQSAVGRPSYGVNPGSAAQAGANSNYGQVANGIASGFLQQTSNAALQQQDINSKRRDSLDRTNETLGALPT